LVEKNYAQVVEGKGRNYDPEPANGDWKGTKEGYEYIVSYKGNNIGDTVNKQEVQAVVDWLANNIEELKSLFGVLSEPEEETQVDDDLVEIMGNATEVKEEAPF
jgi:hypothetical protein